MGHWLPLEEGFRLDAPQTRTSTRITVPFHAGGGAFSIAGSIASENGEVPRVSFVGDRLTSLSWKDWEILDKAVRLAFARFAETT